MQPWQQGPSLSRTLIKTLLRNCIPTLWPIWTVRFHLRCVSRTIGVAVRTFGTVDSDNVFLRLQLLSPPASRDPSPWRLRNKSKSPTRWRMLRSISDAVQNLMSLEEPGIYGMPSSIENFANPHACLRSTFPSLHLPQSLLFTTAVLGALFDISISIISGQSECADPLKRVFLPGL